MIVYFAVAAVIEERSTNRLLDINSSIRHQPDKFLTLYNNWKPICSIAQNYKVIPKFDNINNDLPEERPGA
jgi:hypothetical protein